MKKSSAVNDCNVTRARVRDMLPQGNFKVLEAKDGVEGLNLIRQEQPNLIMLDWLLPKMSGWEVFQQIQNIPLVVMSNSKKDVTEKISEPFESFAFLEKPFTRTTLMQAIKSAMRKAAKRPAQVNEPTSESVQEQAGSSASSAGQIEAINQKISQMQAEIKELKRRMELLTKMVKQN